MVMVDQVVIDAGQAELGWLLTLQGDPPAPLFSAPANVPGSSLRPCSHLVDPRWLAVALGYVKEMEALSTRRSCLVPSAEPEAAKSEAMGREGGSSFVFQCASARGLFGPAFPLLPQLAVRAPVRLKISGDGCWPLADYLGPELSLPCRDKARTTELLKLWALVIDDFYCLSTEEPDTAPHDAASAEKVRTAKATYSAAGVKGSDHKDVLGSRLFLAAGAQVDSAERAHSLGLTLVSPPTGKLFALSIISLRAAALPAISAELASNLAGSWIAALMYRRCLFSVLDGFFGLGKTQASTSQGSPLRFFPRKEAQELVLLASKQLRALWLSTNKKGSYTMLDSAHWCEPLPLFDEAEAELLEGAPHKPLAMNYDVLCLLAGSEEIAASCCEVGLCASPVIDLSRSREFDVLSASFLDWASYLLWQGRARSLVVVLPAGGWNYFGTPKARRQETLWKLGSRALALFKLWIRARRPAFLFFRKGTGFLGNVAAASLLEVSGVSLVPPGRSVCGNSPLASCCPALLFAPSEPPKEFWASRELPHLAALGPAKCLKYLLSVSEQLAPAPQPGLESVAINDSLLSANWEVEKVWRWERPRHINALETEAGVTVLRNLARGPGDLGPVMILDSSCARGALAKGRSSAKLLRPSLRRAAAICVAGGLYPVYAFGPTRLNVSDDPTRDTPLRPPVEHSLLSGLDEPSTVKLCKLAGLSRPRANWVRFVLAAAGEDIRACLDALEVFPERACGSIPPPGLFSTSPCPARAAEDFARIALSRGLVSASSLGHLLELLPSEGRSRFGKEGGTKYWTTGLFAQGPFIGLRSVTARFPWATRLVVECVKSVCPGFEFTSVALLQQVRSSPHRDLNNHPGSRSAVFPLCAFSGGQIWVEGGAGDCKEKVADKVKHGELLEVARGVVFLDGSRLAGPAKHRLKDFDSSLGFPGEGPLGLLFLLLLAWISLPAQPPFSGPETLLTRADLVAALSQWLLEVSGKTLQELLDVKPFDPEVVSDYLVSVTCTGPAVQAAWDLSFAWLAEEPYSHHTAIPPVFFLSLLTAAMIWGWVREAGCFALAFGGLMRIGEVTKCLRRSLILPADVGFTQTFILVQVEEPKTRNKGPRHQAAKVEAQDLVQVVSVAFEKLSASEKLWPLSPQTLRKRLDLLLSQIGASPPPRGTRALDLGSFRAGGATYLLQQTQDSELVRRRGRWASARVMETYLQEIAAVTYLPAVPAGQKARIFAISAGFSSVLRQVIKWTNAAVQSSVWYKL
ncbi:unnamed protein product [Symbiodinium microadriaticum]|nr:unnamed protein product [Symbiodinium sp. KB8]CAE7170660.1 unnamed protein product [Symbiodinium microadriaticum]